MEAVRSLCSRAYLFESGRIAVEGPSSAVVRHYLDKHGPLTKVGETTIADEATRIGNGQARFRSAAIVGQDARPLSEVHLAEPMTVVATVEVLEPIPDAVFEFGISTSDGVRVASLHNVDEGMPAAELAPGLHEIRAEIDVALIPAEYTLDLGLHRVERGATLDMVERVLRVRALATSLDDSDRYPAAANPRGFVRPKSRWHVHSTDPLPGSPIRQ